MKKFLIFLFVLLTIVVLVSCEDDSDRYGKDRDFSSVNFGNVLTTSPKFETLPIDMYMIDYDFDLLCKKSDDIFVEMDYLPIQGDLAPVNVKTTQQIYLSSSRYSSRTEYYIVENGKVVGYLYMTSSSNNTMKNYFPSDLYYDVKPQTVVSESGYRSYCCWKNKDSYLILVTAPSLMDVREYYDCYTYTYILLKDFTQFDFYDQVQ